MNWSEFIFVDFCMKIRCMKLKRMIKYELFRLFLINWIWIVETATDGILLAIQYKLTFFCVCKSTSRENFIKKWQAFARARVCVCAACMHAHKCTKQTETYTKKETIWKNRHISIETTAKTNSTNCLSRTMFLSLSTGNEFSCVRFVWFLFCVFIVEYTLEYLELFSPSALGRSGLIQFGRPNKHHKYGAQKKFTATTLKTNWIWNAWKVHTHNCYSENLLKHQVRAEAQVHDDGECVVYVDMYENTRQLSPNTLLPRDRNKKKVNTRMAKVCLF